MKEGKGSGKEGMEVEGCGGWRGGRGWGEGRRECVCECGEGKEGHGVGERARGVRGGEGRRGRGREGRAGRGREGRGGQGGEGGDQYTWRGSVGPRVLAYTFLSSRPARVSCRPPPAPPPQRLRRAQWRLWRRRAWNPGTPLLPRTSESSGEPRRRRRDEPRGADGREFRTSARAAAGRRDRRSDSAVEAPGALCGRRPVGPQCAGGGGEGGPRAGSMALLDDDSPRECRICFNDFDEAERRPRNLPCGHTFCTQCIAGTFRVNRFMCPSCRAAHVALDVTVFPVSYITEAFVRYVRRRSPERDAVGRRPLQEEEVRLRKLIFGCQETQTHLDHCAAEVAKAGREATRMATRIDAIAEHNRRVLQHMLEEHRRVAGQCGGGAAAEEPPFSPRSRLDFHVGLAATPGDAAALPDAPGGVAAGEQPGSPRDPSAAAPDRFRLSRLTEHIERATAAVRRGDANIWETSQSVAKYKKGARGRSGVVGELEAGGVYALDDPSSSSPPFPGASPPRSARMTLSDEKLYLHVLKDQPAPPYARVLKHSEAMQLVDPFYSVVFLEMGWGGAARGRVHIRLTPNDRRGQQFLSLCTGQGGRSYVDTQLLQVGYKGRPGEYVVGGGLDDVAMEEEELGRECQKRASVGLVWGWCEAEGHTGPSSLGSGSRFAITTKHPGPGTSYCRVFGKVEAGLEVLKAATKLKDITEVTVLDCGIVVTF